MAMYTLIIGDFSYTSTRSKDVAIKAHEMYNLLDGEVPAMLTVTSAVGPPALVDLQPTVRQTARAMQEEVNHDTGPVKRPGRPLLAIGASEHRVHRITLTSNALRALDAVRGDVERSTWIEQAAKG